LKSLFQKAWFELIVRWLLGALFLVACYQKIIEPAHFAKIIYGYYLFPDAAINLIAIILPYVELFSGMALILGIYPRSAALIINAMLLAFIVAISINLIRDHRSQGVGSFSLTQGDLFSNMSRTKITPIFLLRLRDARKNNDLNLEQFFFS